MKTRQHHVLAAFQRAQTFLDTNAASLGRVPDSAPRLALDRIVAGLLANGSAQDLAKTQVTSSVNTTAALRRALIVQHMRPIATIAADHASTLPEISGLTMPHAKTTTLNLVFAANSMAADAALYAQTFTDNGLPVDFVARLQAAAVTLNEALTNTGTLKSNGIFATTSVADLERQGRSKLKVLSALVRPVLLGTPGLLAQWENATRIAPRRSTGTSTAVPALASTRTAAPILVAAPIQPVRPILFKTNEPIALSIGLRPNAPAAASGYRWPTRWASVPTTSRAWSSALALGVGFGLTTEDVEHAAHGMPRLTITARP